LVKKTTKDARTIIAKHSRKSTQKAIAKFQQLISLKPKQGNKIIFYHTGNPPLDSIMDTHNNILTNPIDIADEIYTQQSKINAPTIKTCKYQTLHHPYCTCLVRQYPWHDLNGFILQTRGNNNVSISILFTRETYDNCVKHLSKYKTPGIDQIPNSILKNMPTRFHNMLFLFFSHCYKQRTIPSSWKNNNTILLYKNGLLYHLSNHHPIALANTIYKLFTSTVTTLLSSYGEQHQIIHNSQEGFRQERCTSRQIQTIIATLEDARFTPQDIYLLYIDFTNAFGSIDHARLLAIMLDLGYPTDAVKLIGNIYSESHTTINGQYFGTTKPIAIQRGSIQGDTLNPYLFLIFLKPLLRWLDQNQLGYNFKTSTTSINSAAYADDLAVLFQNIKDLQLQLNKIEKNCAWVGMDLSINKCAITRYPNKSKLTPTTFTAYIQSHNIQFRNQNLPILHQNEPYKYLGIQLVPSLTWKIQIHTTMTKLNEQCKLLKASPATMKQKIHMTDSVIRAGIAYGFYIVTFSLPTINKLEKIQIGLQKSICGLPNSSPNVMTQLPHNMFGLEAFSHRNAYLRCIGELRDALKYTGQLGIIYQGLINYISTKHGGAQNIPRITPQSCVRSPITRTLFLLKQVASTHIRKNHDNFPLTSTSLENVWLAHARTRPNININLCLHFLNKLLLYHINSLSQLTLPNETHLMTPEEFQTYHNKPTKIIKSALHLASQLFCHTQCHNQCTHPCPTPSSPNTLHQTIK
jgi:hypothetical protein